MNANGKPTKLRDGTWGATVQGTVRSGEMITVRSRGGKTWEAKVSRVVWQGNGVTIVGTVRMSSREDDEQLAEDLGDYSHCYKVRY